jgi:quercetin dioxygenase-like cupin family protein
MHCVPYTDAPGYSAPGHTDMAMRRLQGLEAGPSDSVWIGLSEIAPGGGTTSAASPVEKFYVCLAGEVEVQALHGAQLRTVVLAPLDSCRIAPGEARQLHNRGPGTARLLLVMPQTA